jgi:hypothetical protein
LRQSQRYKKRQQQKKEVVDRTLWFTDLTSLDPSLKNELWAAQALFYMKRTGGSVLFLDPKKAKPYRDLDILKVDEELYKQMFDPKTPGDNGGKAEYVSSDFKINPIYIHLMNIVKADILKTGKQLEVNMTDKYAKTRQMNDNYKILYQEAFRKIINRLSKELGLPGISDAQDPYKWASNMFSDNKEINSPDVVNKFVDLIRNQITDDQDLALYNEFVYKGDYEIAFELGIKYYIQDLNKWNARIADDILNDLKHFNKAALEYTTDLITGRPIINRYVPESLFTNPFRDKLGNDIEYYWIEYTVSFGDFMRTMGKNLKPEKLKEVFVLMRNQGVHRIDWKNDFINFGIGNYTRDSALVKIGKAAMLSTDMEVHMENITTGTYEQRPLTWEPISEDEERIEKRYNVWRWWYYIPATAYNTQNVTWEWQKDFIFELQKFQDQQRYGDDGRYSKPPLIILDNSSQASFTDIVETFNPKITHLWHRYQNYLVNDLDATILSEDLINGMLAAIDEDNNINFGDKEKPTGGNGRDAYMQQWKLIKQGGKGFLKMTDKAGNQILDPSKMVLPIKNGYMEKAEGCLTQMFLLYELMIKALAFSPTTAGEETKPRTPVAAIEQSIKVADSSRFYLQKSYEDLYVMVAERMVRFILDIFKEKDKYKFPYRYDEFMDNVGYANGLLLEGLKDVDPESVGLTVSYVDTQAMKEFVLQLGIEYAKNKELSEDFLYLLMGTDNWKYAFVLMRMAIKKRKQELEQQAQVAHGRQMELEQAKVQSAILIQKAKDAGKDQNILTEGKVEIMINDALNRAKYQSQSQLKKETDDLRQGENFQKSELSKSEETHKENLKQQQALSGS